jgi:hypothetical protein
LAGISPSSLLITVGLGMLIEIPIFITNPIPHLNNELE